MATIPGTAGDDSLLGTNDADFITGGAGHDTLDGGPGNDTVDGGEGADLLYWDEDPSTTGAHDVYHGGTGGEEFDSNPYSQNGGDTLNLGHNGHATFTVNLDGINSGVATDAYGNTVEFDGIERFVLGGGDDFIDASGVTSDDHVGIRVHSGAGNDTIHGSDETDYIHGGDGDDLIYGGDGNDVIEGGAGDDTVYGGDGDDGIRWGNGNNDGPVGNDLYYGGAGFNTLNAWQADWDHHGVVVHMTSSDSGTVDATGAATGHLDFYEFQNLLTGNGNDTIDGSGAGVNGFRTYAASGDDLIIGSAGDDTIEGGDGADTIEAGGGDDLISMAGDLFAGYAPPDSQTDVLVLRDGFGHDTVRAFAIETTDSISADRLDVSDLHDADGNPVDLDDVTVQPFADEWGNQHTKLLFPNGETLILTDILPEAVTREVLHHIGIPCFCRGTLIQTNRGEIAVEQLVVGDLVVTRDHGLQSIRWIGSRALDAVDLGAAPRLQPIRIRAGALGSGLPSADLMVSPQHRVLVRSAIAQRMFDTPEVLVAAKQLLAIEGVEQAATNAVEYFHLLFDRHEIVISNGAETESLFTGAQALRSIGAAARDEIFTLFPELRGTPAEAARPLVPGAKARQLAQRHARNGKALMG